MQPHTNCLTFIRALLLKLCSHRHSHVVLTEVVLACFTHVSWSDHLHVPTFMMYVASHALQAVSPACTEHYQNLSALRCVMPSIPHRWSFAAAVRLHPQHCPLRQQWLRIPNANMANLLLAACSVLLHSTIIT